MKPSETENGHSCHTGSIVPDESQTAMPSVDRVGLAGGDNAAANPRPSTRRSAPENPKSRGRRSSVRGPRALVPERPDTPDTAHNVYYVKL